MFIDDPINNNNTVEHKNHIIRVDTIKAVSKLEMPSKVFVWNGLLWERLQCVETRRVNVHKLSKQETLCTVYNARNLLRCLGTSNIVSMKAGKADTETLKQLLPKDVINIIADFCVPCVEMSIRNPKMSSDKQFWKKCPDWEPRLQGDHNQPLEIELPRTSIPNIVSETNCNFNYEGHPNCDLRLLNQYHNRWHSEYIKCDFGRECHVDAQQIILGYNKCGFGGYTIFKTNMHGGLWFNTLNNRAIVHSKNRSRYTWYHGETLRSSYNLGRRSMTKSTKIVPFLYDSKKRKIFDVCSPTDLSDLEDGSEKIRLELPEEFNVYKVRTRSGFWAAGVGRMLLYN